MSGPKTIHIVQLRIFSPIFSPGARGGFNFACRRLAHVTAADIQASGGKHDISLRDSVPPAGIAVGRRRLYYKRDHAKSAKYAEARVDLLFPLLDPLCSSLFFAESLATLNLRVGSYHLSNCCFLFDSNTRSIFSKYCKSLHFWNPVTNNKKISPPRSNPTPASTEMGVAALEEGAASRLWTKFQHESAFAFYTPFVVCLAAGNLELETFRSYISQGVHYLQAFARAYQMAAECSDDDDAKVAMSEFRKGVLEQLQMHDSVMKEWGVYLSKEDTSNPATLKYTDFLLSTAAGKIEGGKGLAKIVTPFEKTKLAAYTIGAMTPYIKLYAVLGKEILSLSGSVQDCHPYKRWLDNYSSETFQALAKKTEDLLDKLCITLTGEELEVIERLYLQAMKFEVEFLSSLPSNHSSVVPFSRVHDAAEARLVIFSDFDLTCTIVDSSAILAEIAILSAFRTDQHEVETSHYWKSTDLRKSWDVLSRQYTEEYGQCINDIMPSERVEAFSYSGLCTALEKISAFEKRANSRVIRLGVLKGLNVEDIKRAGERLIFHDGCTKFFEQMAKNKEKLNADVHILSFCWSGDLIRSSFSSGALNVVNIHANELTYDESFSTGEIIKKIESPLDKIGAFQDILRSLDDAGKHLTVYIGDSLGDLLCLLEADVGIVVGSSASLRRVAGAYGVSFVPLFPGIVKKQKEFMKAICNWNGLTGVLYTVSGWAEIHAFILGLP